MSKWTESYRPAITKFLKARWDFFCTNFWDVIFWLPIAMLIGRWWP